MPLKIIKYLEIHSIRELQYVYTENCKTLLKKMEKRLQIHIKPQRAEKKTQNNLEREKQNW